MKFDNNFKEIKIRHIIIMFLVVIFISMILIIVFSSKEKLSDTFTNKLSLFIEALFAFMIFFKLRISKKNVKLLYTDFKKNVNMKEIAYILLFITCLEIGSSNVLIDITYIISPNLSNWFINDSSSIINSIIDYLIVFIQAVFLTPFTDEIIFRNVLFKRISKKFNIYIGLIVSSIIYSSVNFGSQMVGYFLFGIVNCMLYVKYENILMPMIIYCIDGVIGMIKFTLFGQFANTFIILTSNDIILYGISGGTLFIIGMVFFIKFVCNNKVYLNENFGRNISVEIY